ncbi:hypothetical protein BC939DRAFT_506269 [Gamsiella multidivaricata]|uniref:uncharacterized protein n=1 Tax=Gamsiella multidivaricata TaxID=101098 RepID=UPI00221F33DD|nr:uncharacterized protein BC939DRAFT_506269 [Gamsiella multidivaricata]KAG0362497.1 hypothetical protein BGZ54_008593 [Gamsiella multidivaricata]KAI7818787.1 hypothetical protein BC939DRAFT_506269 [Gamsiella multidivaricata]
MTATSLQGSDVPAPKSLPRLPAELLSSIFRHLEPYTLKRFLTVSRAWYTEIIPVLYSRLVFSKYNHESLFSGFKTHRRHIRAVEWTEDFYEGMSFEDAQDILLDIPTTASTDGLEKRTPLTPRPNQPTLQSLRLFSNSDNMMFQDEFIYHFISLTDLSLTFEGESTIYIALDRLFEGMPHLRYLSLEGVEYGPLDPESRSLDRNAPPYRLETFSFNVWLLYGQSQGINVLRRLQNLSSIRIIDNTFLNLRKNQPLALAQSLHASCPKLKMIETEGKVPFYFYLLPPSAESSPMNSHGRTYEAQQHLEEQQRQQCEDSLELFPKLTTLISRKNCALSAEDLRCLGARAQFLTHVELGDWNIDLDNPIGYVADSRGDSHGQRDPRAQWRHLLTSLDLQIFLETCQHLRHFVARRTIQLSDMTPPNRTLSAIYYMPNRNGRTVRAAKPWACERTLETLEIGFRMASTVPSDHRIVFEQLGRCRRLKSLGLTRSNLIPTLRHGMDLLEDLAETLEEVISWSSNWVCDDKETVLWLMERFKKLKKMGVNCKGGSTLADRVLEWTPRSVAKFL